MSTIKRLKTLVQTALAAAAAGGLAAALYGAEPAAANGSGSVTTNSAALSPTAPGAAQTPVKTQITGAELYSMHCNRCHPERYPTERTAAQWKTIMLHMQVRANIPGAQARQILKYLQENSGR
jgi:cytochrome c5